MTLSYSVLHLHQYTGYSQLLPEEKYGKCILLLSVNIYKIIESVITSTFNSEKPNTTVLLGTNNIVS